MKTATLVIPFDSIAAGTAEELYVSMPYKGKWAIESVKIAPNTAVAVAGTNYTTVTLASNDGAGGAFTSIASITSNTGGTALVIGTTVSPTVTQPATIQEGYMFRVGKVDTGTGALHDACWSIGLRKVA